MTTVSKDIEQVVARLAPETRRQRQTALLRPLNLSLIAVSLAGLVVMAVIGGDVPGLVVVVSSLLVNLVVAALERSGRVRLASHLFSVWVNFGILFFVAINLLGEGNLAVGLTFACVLAMSVMLAGMLLGALYGFLFAAADAIAVIAMLVAHFDDPRAGLSPRAFDLALSAGVPVVAFLAIVAVITWLYQRSLDLSEAHLSLARQRIMQDELIRRDLAIARELQQRLYPPPPITSRAIQIASRSEPARETSGDFYDYIDLDDGQLGIVVADVTGKSVAAALLMALARGTLRSAARRHSSPAEVLAQANDALCRDQTARQMITAFYGILDTRTLTLRFANAGHPYPVLRRGAQIVEVELNGLPLGGRFDARYDEDEIQLLPGDQLFLLSDGLVEERNGHRELFGYDRLNDAILAADPDEPEHALDDLWRAVTAFREGTDQDDDITLVVIQALHALAIPGEPAAVGAGGTAP